MNKATPKITDPKQTIAFNAEFVKSILQMKDRPELVLPELAFAGRSNVGKSSLLNAIFGRRNLVKTSSTPGKTQTINYFIVNKKFYCVDLPGYGFAKTPKNIQSHWQKMVEQFIKTNKQLRNIFVLVDSRHETMQSDLQMLDWLDYLGVPKTIVLSKIDKISKNLLDKRLSDLYKLNKSDYIYPVSIKDSQSIFQFKQAIIDALHLSVAN